MFKNRWHLCLVGLSLLTAEACARDKEYMVVMYLCEGRLGKDNLPQHRSRAGGGGVFKNGETGSGGQGYQIRRGDVVVEIMHRCTTTLKTRLGDVVDLHLRMEKTEGPPHAVQGDVTDLVEMVYTDLPAGSVLIVPFSRRSNLDVWWEIYVEEYDSTQKPKKN